ncbi:VWA domain-containing protein [Saccharothrix deserti]|uniref:VWA domain-containing protein n=1 Tax=Saccharothrix deserti TaxID=2593674 RepID=UPI00131C3EC0|nr:vWA domain-containing protein [Saccharothrix deserti]
MREHRLAIRMEYGGNRRRRLALVAAALCVGASLPVFAPVGGAQDVPATLPPLQVVVLVDQSGSLEDADVVKEKEAARTILFSALAPGSVISVVGFGSSDRPGQSAVDVVCPPTRLDAAQKRDSVAKCIGDLHKRTEEEGDGTDHVAALQQALDFVGSGGPEKKVVFLLTDGKLDVSGSPQWGDSPDRRNEAARAKVGDVLAQLDGAGAQVWPLGFGAVDVGALGGFAKGKSCTPAAPDPHEQVVPTSTELTSAVANAFSSASCIKYGPPDTGSVPKGGSVDLHVDIPVIASDASILVYKRDARVQVSYLAPNANNAAPAEGGKDFEFAGQATETESLRITDPQPGRWTVRLSSAEVAAMDVAATVVYQAAVKAYLTVSPPQPAAGQTVGVDMQVWARGRAVVDRQALEGLAFVVTLTGSSGFPAQQVTLADPDGDGTFGGQLKVPDNATGDLTFTGQVTGIGVGGDTRVLSTKVQKAASLLESRILFDDNSASATPGGTVPGTVEVTNNSGKPARLRLELVDVTQGTSLTVEPSDVEAKTGVTNTAFALRFGPDTPEGVSGAKLRLVDDANPSAVVAERLFSTTVKPAPGIVERFFWVWVALAVVLVVAVVFGLLRLWARSRAKRVRGLSAQLWRGGFAISDLVPRDPDGKVFTFLVHDDFTGLQLQHAGPGEANVYEVRRAGRTIVLTPPGRPSVVVTPGEHHDIGGDLAVVVLDERGTTPGAPADPFAPPAPDPFAMSQAPSAPLDPFAGTTGAAAPTAPYPSRGGSPGDNTYADPFAGGSANGRDHAPPPGPAPSADRGYYVDPNNPFD